MLALLTGDTLCPCCVFGISKAPSRSSSFTCEPAPALSDARHIRRDVAPAWAADVRLDGGTVVDPRDGSMIENASILVRQGRIIAIDQGGSVKSDPSVQRIDVSGKYVVPGYNDMHSHVLELDDPSGALALMLSEGVTGFRQMSGSPERLAQRRDGRLPLDERAPALLETPGTVLTPLNAATPEQVVEEVRAQKTQGADFIKVGFASPPVFNAALQEAERQGLSMLGHHQDRVHAAHAADEGFRSIEHLGPGSTVWLACVYGAAEASDGDLRPGQVQGSCRRFRGPRDLALSYPGSASYPRVGGRSRVCRASRPELHARSCCSEMAEGHEPVS